MSENVVVLLKLFSLNIVLLAKQVRLTFMTTVIPMTALARLVHTDLGLLYDVTLTFIVAVDRVWLNKQRSKKQHKYDLGEALTMLSSA